MIAKATVISHGANAVRYATEKDKSESIKVNCLPDDVPAEGIWQRMVIHQKRFEDKLNRYRHLKNNAIRIEVSPARDESKGWTHADWERLANDFVQEFDMINLSSRASRASAARTGLAGSQYVVALHRDSRSGIAHLHIVANRVDMEGNVNDAHFIYERAMEAARRINIQRGWLTAEERSEQNRKQIADDCLDILRQMSKFNLEEYVQWLGCKGYVVNLKRDSKDIVRGYTIGKGNSVYKSSQLGLQVFSTRHRSSSDTLEDRTDLAEFASGRANCGGNHRKFKGKVSAGNSNTAYKPSGRPTGDQCGITAVYRADAYCTLRHRGRR